MLRCAHDAADQQIAKWENKMEVAGLVLPVFAIIVTGWLAWLHIAVAGRWARAFRL